MDEKTQNESEARVGMESSGDNGHGPAEKKIDQNSKLLEDVSSEPEGKDSAMKTPSLDHDSNDDSIPSAANTAETADEPPTDDSETPAETAGEIETETDKLQADEATPDKDTGAPETARPPGEEGATARQESEKPETESAHETLPIDSSDGDDAEASEEKKESGTKDADLDEAGANTEDKQTQDAAEYDSSDTDEVEQIQGSPEETVASEEIDEKQEDKGDVEGDDGEVQTQIEPDTAGAEEQTSDLAEGKTIETSAKKISALKVTVSTIVIAAAFSGFLIFDNKSKIETKPKAALKISEKQANSANRHKKTNIIKPLTPAINSIYTAKIEEISALRDSLLRKQEEVMRLKKHYQDGIEELEKEISDELQKGESSTFLQAMENKGVAFTLRTIQRRQAYIQQLERPSKWIFKACEELLYIKRRTVVDIQVAAIAGGIDMNQHLRHINAAVRKYQPAADKLTPDMTNAQIEPLEIIWERIQDKTRQYASVRAHSKNQIISEQICTGNFNRLTEISEISAETASCITEMQGSDLFLNGLAEISPGATRQLVRWKGSWICLNGVRALSPRVAHYLFQWDGNWISLNGLTEFPAEIGETLLQWGGHQLELMGLQYAEDFPTKIAVEYLARWERAGGKLFVPKSVRKKIDEMHREPT
jgi:hypothetical protein